MKTVGRSLDFRNRRYLPGITDFFRKSVCGKAVGQNPTKPNEVETASTGVYGTGGSSVVRADNTIEIEAQNGTKFRVRPTHVRSLDPDQRNCHRRRAAFVEDAVWVSRLDVCLFTAQRLGRKLSDEPIALSAFGMQNELGIPAADGRPGFTFRLTAVR